MLRSLRWPVLGLTIASSCALAEGGARLEKGVWGGDDATLEVVEGGVNLEFECAAGWIQGPVRLDQDGRFDLPGTLTPRTPGPTRDDSVSATPVRYRGSVKGDTMNLVVRKEQQDIGAHTLTRGRRAILRTCR